jgi:hypothetical protein
MKPSRQSRFIATIIAVISLLFSHVALASYACPGPSMPERTTIAPAGKAMPVMDHCTGMDAAQPPLCHAHMHAWPQSLNKPDLPAVLPFFVTGPVLSIILLEAGATPPGVMTSMPSLSHATEPASAIRYCCFRI